jgi:hypothetical protein
MGYGVPNRKPERERFFRKVVHDATVLSEKTPPRTPTKAKHPSSPLLAGEGTYLAAVSGSELFYLLISLYLR